MCGIMGYVGNDSAVPLIIDGLRKLEYRGYDSAGIAVYNGSRFDVVKRKGRLEVLADEIGRDPRFCSGDAKIGIGHTRWATHGEPSNENSHPHLGSGSRIAVVHNGIIENYAHLREKLIKNGVVFASETDTEVIAQLAEFYYNGDIIDTVIKVLNTIEGSYALGFMCLDEPDRIIAVKKDNPLIIGISENGNFIASDVPAILRHTSRVCYLGDREIAVLESDSVSFYNTDRECVEKIPETVTWSFESAEKGGYEHFMFKEIMEQPLVLRNTIRSALTDGENKSVIDNLNIEAYAKIVIIACGSAYNAGMVSRYVFESLGRIPVDVELASEFRYRDAIIDRHTLVIAISQSGETADTIAAMREAKRKNAAILAIVNVVGSTVAKEADQVLYTLAGPEIAVATTKAFSTQLAILYILAVKFAQRLRRITADQAEGLLSEIETLPAKAEELFKQTDRIQHYAAACFNCKSIFFIGRNIDYAIALEGSLKLKEISYIHSEAYAGGELKHGTISLIEDDTLVVAISSCERLYSKIMSNVEQVISRGARVLFITNSNQIKETDKFSLLKMADINELFSPSLSVILLQLFSYYVAVNKGCDIDKPRNLAKSVTVE